VCFRQRGHALQGADVDSVWGSYLIADKSGNRMDANRAYLEPVRDTCTNLEVIEGATVTSILLDGNTTASGVQYKIGKDGAPQV
jgi:choline dehydrogenase-like flavoprotein